VWLYAASTQSAQTHTCREKLAVAKHYSPNPAWGHTWGDLARPGEARHGRLAVRLGQVRDALVVVCARLQRPAPAVSSYTRRLRQSCPNAGINVQRNRNYRSLCTPRVAEAEAILQARLPSILGPWTGVATHQQVLGAMRAVPARPAPFGHFQPFDGQACTCCLRLPMVNADVDARQSIPRPA
jgi:hypothetical protein